MAPNVRKSVNLRPGFHSPADLRALRTDLHTLVNKYIPEVDQVLAGEKDWSRTQVVLFKTLLDKVLPNIDAKFVKHDHTHRRLEEMSREELEQIARGD